MKRMAGFVFVALLFTLSTGCVTSKGMQLKNANLSPAIYTTQEQREESKDLWLEQADAIGVRETAGILSGNVTSKEVWFPEEFLRGELGPGRVSWFGWCVTPDRKEFLAQITTPTKGASVKGQVVFVGDALIDGSESDLVGAKLIGISTRGVKGSNLQFDQRIFQIDWKRFQKEASYRYDLVMNNGVEVAKLRPSNILNSIATWNRFKGPRGHMLTPLGSKELWEMAEKNPAYSWVQKYFAHGSFVLSTDPTGMAISQLINAYHGFTGKSRGWDFGSPRTKEERQFIDAYIDEMKAKVSAKQTIARKE